MRKFPRDIRFLYGYINDPDNKKIDEYLYLYAVRAFENQPARLSNEDVQEAIAEKLKDNEGQISLLFKPAAAKKWARMTKDNLDKPIAMIVNDLVVSSPNVNGVIEEGNSVINGGFTLKEAQDICNQLNSGKMPADIVIVKQDITKIPPSLFPGIKSFIL